MLLKVRIDEKGNVQTERTHGSSARLFSVLIIVSYYESGNKYLIVDMLLNVEKLCNLLGIKSIDELENKIVENDWRIRKEINDLLNLQSDNINNRYMLPIMLFEKLANIIGLKIDVSQNFSMMIIVEKELNGYSIALDANAV